jgi:hypothetical protein
MVKYKELIPTFVKYSDTILNQLVVLLIVQLKLKSNQAIKKSS